MSSNEDSDPYRVENWSTKLFPSTAVGIGSGPQLYVSFISSFQVASASSNWWQDSSIVYAIISIAISALLGITTATNLDRNKWVRVVNVFLAFVMVVSTGLNTKFRPGETARRYSEVALRFQDAAASYRDEHNALKPGSPSYQDDDNRLVSKYSRLLTNLSVEMSNIKTNFGIEPDPEIPAHSGHDHP